MRGFNNRYTLSFQSESFQPMNGTLALYGGYKVTYSEFKTLILDDRSFSLWGLLVNIQQNSGTLYDILLYDTVLVFKIPKSPYPIQGGPERMQHLRSIISKKRGTE